MNNSAWNQALQGQVAVITGGHSGIGFYLSQALLAVGMKVAILARRTDVLEKAASDLSGEVLPVVCDISNPDAVREAFALCPFPFPFCSFPSFPFPFPSFPSFPVPCFPFPLSFSSRSVPFLPFLPL